MDLCNSDDVDFFFLHKLQEVFRNGTHVYFPDALFMLQRSYQISHFLVKKNQKL